METILALAGLFIVIGAGFLALAFLALAMAIYGRRK